MVNLSPQSDNNEGFLGVLKTLNSRMPSANLALPIGVVAILFVLLIPMPTWLLDISFSISIMLSVLVLMVVIFVESPAELSSFPTILLIVTMLRLALNVASTRLILSHGNQGSDAAGAIIHAFGSFVVQGNYVIGAIVFAILVIINFIVLTKGAGRIAEVAARFALDAMPGKQMAIDADLSAGYINDQEAKKRREALATESAFYGAMDGASKFVRGDATAGILITFINIIAGMIIGVAQKDLTFAQAAHNYTLLTIGDGLVSQVPALIVSTAAGILVTKSGISGETQSAIVKEFSGHSGALFMAMGLLLAMGLIPEMPLMPFFLMAALCGGAGYYIYRSDQNNKKEKALEEEIVQTQQLPPETELPEYTIASALHIDLIRIELGYSLLELLSDIADYKLTDQIKSLRRQLASDMGFILPSVRIQDNLQLPENTYVIRIKEIEEGRGDLYPNRFLLINPSGQEIPMEGEHTVEPTFGMPAMWISADDRDKAIFDGYTVVDPATVIITHLTEILKKNMPDLLSYGETQKLINELPEDEKKIADYLIPEKVSIGVIQRILQSLLAENVSIRDLPTILEGVSDLYGQTSNVVNIIEHIRTKLSRQISYANINNQGILSTVILSPEFEEIFREHTVNINDNIQLNMPPSRIKEFVEKINRAYHELAEQGVEDPVLLVAPNIRFVVRSLVERFRPQTIVMSQAEVHVSVQLETLFVIEAN